MTPLILLIVAIHLIGVAIILTAIFKAPYGYEDQNGFHPERTPEPDQSHAGSP